MVTACLTLSRIGNVCLEVVDVFDANRQQAGIGFWLARRLELRRGNQAFDGGGNLLGKEDLAGDSLMVVDGVMAACEQTETLG